MGWTTPRDWTVGEIATEAIMDTHIKDNLRYLKGLDGAVTLSDALILPDGAGYYLHIPSLTTTQRDALTPTNGMIIYNSTLTVFQVYENTAWVSRTDMSKMVMASQAAGDLFYGTSATATARLGIGTANQLLRTNAGATAPEWATISPATIVLKTSDETINNNNTLQNDDQLLLAVGVNEKWEFLLWLDTTSTANTDFKYAFAIPTASALLKVTSGQIAQLTANESNITPLDGTASAASVTSGANKLYLNYYRYIGGANAGNVQLQWAQVTSHADSTTVHANSFILAHKLA